MYKYMDVKVQWRNLTLVEVKRNSTQCFVCLETIFRSKYGASKCWQTENGNNVCQTCLDTWAKEGGELGKISRSKLPMNGFEIK